MNKPGDLIEMRSILSQNEPPRKADSRETYDDEFARLQLRADDAHERRMRAQLRLAELELMFDATDSIWRRAIIGLRISVQEDIRNRAREEMDETYISMLGMSRRARK